MTLAAGILTVALLAAEPSELVRRALPASSLRVEVIDTRLGLPEGCTPRRVALAAPVERSGVVPLSAEGIRGAGACTGKGWARVRVFAKVWQVTQSIRAGEALGGAVALAERELSGPLQPLQAFPAGALARVALAKGTILEARHLRGDGPSPGERVVVQVQVGSVLLEQPAVAMACPGRPCARLANGARVEGRYEDGKLKVTP
ncbi:MAG: hypothetical protein AB1938_04320 [Myxococcota bacterium]